MNWCEHSHRVVLIPTFISHTITRSHTVPWKIYKCAASKRETRDRAEAPMSIDRNEMARWHDSVRLCSAQSVVCARVYMHEIRMRSFCTQTDRYDTSIETRGTHTHNHNTILANFSSPLLFIYCTIWDPENYICSDPMCKQRYCIERKSKTRITYITV